MPEKEIITISHSPCVRPEKLKKKKTQGDFYILNPEMETSEGWVVGRGKKRGDRSLGRVQAQQHHHQLLRRCYISG